MKFKARCHGCFAALADSNRIEIIKLLQVNKKMNVADIAKHFKLTQPTITHHLRYLEERGIVNFKKEGRRVYYHISPPCGKNECGIF